MEWLRPLAGGDKVNQWLQACTAPRPPKLMQVDWEGAPKNRKMLASVAQQPGGVSYLKQQSVELPFELDDNEVLVEVHAAGVNQLDCKLRRGELAKECPISFPAVLGMDLSGVVRKIGSHVVNFRTGDTVFGRQTLERMAQGRNGSYAEWCVVHEDNLALKPTNLTHEQAAGAPTAGLVAWSALSVGGLGEAGKVVVIGGSGGVGSFAVQIAKKHYDAYVVVVCSSRHQKLVEKMGADELIDYTVPSWREESERLKGFDLVIDTVGLDEYWEVFGRKVLSSKGRYVALNSLRASADTPKASKLGGIKEGEEGVEGGGMFEKQLLSAKSGVLNLGGGLFSGFKLLSLPRDVTDDALAELRELLQDGAVKVMVDSVHELRDVDKAHMAAESAHAGGKVLVRIRKPWERESVQNMDIPSPTGAAAEGGSLMGFLPKSSLGPEEKQLAREAELQHRSKIAEKRAQELLSRAAVEQEQAQALPLTPGRSQTAGVAARQPALPPGWEFAYDPSGVVYYYSHALGVSQYEHPREGVLGEKVAEPEVAAHGAAGGEDGSADVKPSATETQSRPKPKVGLVTGDAATWADEGGRGTMEDVRPADLTNVKKKGQSDSGKARSAGEKKSVAAVVEQTAASESLPQTTSWKAEGTREEAVSVGSSDVKAPTKCGLGVTLKMNKDGQYYVKRMERGGPAERSGRVKDGDTLLAVDGRQVTGIEYKDLAQLVLGDEGSVVTVALMDTDTLQVRKVHLERFPIDARLLEQNEEQVREKDKAELQREEDARKARKLREADARRNMETHQPPAPAPAPAPAARVAPQAPPRRSPPQPQPPLAPGGEEARKAPRTPREEEKERTAASMLSHQQGAVRSYAAVESLPVARAEATSAGKHAGTGRAANPSEGHNSHTSSLYSTPDRPAPTPDKSATPSPRPDGSTPPPRAPQVLAVKRHNRNNKSSSPPPAAALPAGSEATLVKMSGGRVVEGERERLLKLQAEGLFDQDVDAHLAQQQRLRELYQRQQAEKGALTAQTTQGAGGGEGAGRGRGPQAGATEPESTSEQHRLHREFEQHQHQHQLHQRFQQQQQQQQQQSQQQQHKQQPQYQPQQSQQRYHQQQQVQSVAVPSLPEHPPATAHDIDAAVTARMFAQHASRPHDRDDDAQQAERRRQQEQVKQQIAMHQQLLQVEEQRQQALQQRVREEQRRREEEAQRRAQERHNHDPRMDHFMQAHGKQEEARESSVKWT